MNQISEIMKGAALLAWPLIVAALVFLFYSPIANMIKSRDFTVKIGSMNFQLKS